MGLRAMKTPVHTPQRNAFCERFIGTARRESLDRIAPLSERYLRRLVAEWIGHSCAERPPAALAHALPDAASPPAPPDIV
jgi:transposase InsO family protein